QGNRDEGHPPPDVGKNYRPARVPRVAEKIDIRRDQSELPQRPGNNGELRIKQPPEGDRREHCRHDERNKDDGADNCFEGQPLMQQKRKIESDGELYGAGNGSVEQSVEDREPEDRIVTQEVIVLDADELAAATEPRICEGEPDAESERISEKQDEEGCGRQH